MGSCVCPVEHVDSQNLGGRETIPVLPLTLTDSLLGVRWKR